MTGETTHIPKRVLFCGFSQKHNQIALTNHLNKFSYDLIGLLSLKNYLEEFNPVFFSQRSIYRTSDFSHNPGPEMPSREIIRAMRPVETVFLKMLDRTYKSPFKFRKYEFRKQVYYAQVAHALSILKTHRFDQLLFSIVPHNPFDYVLHHLAQHLGISSIFLTQMQVKDCFFHATDITRIYHPIQAALPDQTSTELPVHLEDEVADRKGDGQPFYMSHANLSWKQILYRKQKRILRRQSYTQPLFAIPSFLSYLTTSKLKSPPSNKYIYFALHYQPESSTSPMGGVFGDQYYAVLMLARSVPEGVDILVKENPRQRYWQRSTEFYRLLKAEKNVKFAHRKADSRALTRNSLAVASITGTVGWEAVFEKKPAFIFGNVFYRFIKGVVTVEDQDSIRQAIEKIENGTFEYASEDDIRKYLATIHRIGHTGVVDQEYFRNSRYSQEESTKTLQNLIEKLTT